MKMRWLAIGLCLAAMGMRPAAAPAEAQALRDDQQAEMVSRINAIAAEIRREDAAIRQIDSGPCRCGAASHAACKTPEVCEPQEEAAREARRKRISDLRAMLPKVRALVTGIQQGEVLLAAARSLVDSGRFQWPGTGSTYCDDFLEAYARSAYAYDDFRDRNANGILDLLRTTPREWTPVHDRNPGREAPRPGKIDAAALQARLQQAQDYANEGYLVVVGLVTGPKEQPGGHVSVVLPGALAESVSWLQAGLPGRLPVIAQAGRDTFAGRHLGYGFTPMDLAGGEMVIYVRRPSPAPSR